MMKYFFVALSIVLQCLPTTAFAASYSASDCDGNSCSVDYNYVNQADLDGCDTFCNSQGTSDNPVSPGAGGSLGAPQGATLANSTIKLDNPLVSSDPRIIAAHLISAMLGIIGSISLLMFVYGGVLWITSMGNDKTVAKGKAVLVYAVIGLAVIAGAYTLTNAVISGLTTGSVVPK